MKLQGLHHITMITGDAQNNVAFSADLLGLRLVKKTVDFDAPEANFLEPRGINPRTAHREREQVTA